MHEKKGVITSRPDLPLSVSNENWQRFSTCDQQSCNQSTSDFTINIGDSLSNASDDDETASRIRESLKKELKMIQVAKADLKIKRKRKRSGVAHSTTSSLIRDDSSSCRASSVTGDFMDQITSLKQKVVEKNMRIQHLEKRSIREQAEIELKDMRIVEEVATVDKLKSEKAELDAKNREL